jgi:hypothetical protein
MVENELYLRIDPMPNLFGRKIVGDVDVESRFLNTREDDDTPTSEAEDKDIDEDEEDRHTILERNNAIAANPIQLNLAKTSTCMELANYAVEVQEKALECDAEECWGGVTRILSDVPVLLSCDGAPATIVKKMKLKDPENVPVD